MAKPNLSHCPAGCSNGYSTRMVQAVYKDEDGKDYYKTEEVVETCSTCDGSGTVVDWSG